MTGAELCQRLRISPQQLAAWVRKGLPSEGSGKARTYDAAAVRDWLIAHGHAEAPPAAPAPAVPAVTVRTIDEVARHFAVSRRTVATWITEGMPGKVGSPGRGDGAFPLAEIQAWLDGRPKDLAADQPADSKHVQQARVARYRADLLELDVAERTGQLIDAQEAAGHWVRLITEARSQLDGLPARVLKRLPPDLAPAIRAKVRADIESLVHRALGTLELYLRHEADALQDAEAAADEAAGNPDDDGDSARDR